MPISVTPETHQRLIAELMTEKLNTPTLRDWEPDETPGETRTCVTCNVTKLVVRFHRRRESSTVKYHSMCMMCRGINTRLDKRLRKQQVSANGKGMADSIRQFYAADRVDHDERAVTKSSKSKPGHFHHWEWPPTGDTWTSRALCSHPTETAALQCRFHDRFTFLGGCAATCEKTVAERVPLPEGYVQLLQVS